MYPYPYAGILQEGSLLRVEVLGQTLEHPREGYNQQWSPIVFSSLRLII
jgi:hypothetical protein